MFGGVNKSLVQSKAGTYIYKFRAKNDAGYSADTWTLTLTFVDVVEANINFYVGRDQNYSTNGNKYPILKMYKTAGIDENQFDYVGWFTDAEGKTVYVYNPADYTIIDGEEKDYVEIDGTKYELHDYEQNPEEFASHYESYAKDGILAWDNHAPRQKQIVGIQVFISEYGGIKWDVEGVNKDSWGYGDGPRTEEEFLARYKGLTDVLLDNPKMFGFCYTQLYDVEQEMNGLYTYGRKPKFDMEIIRRITSRKAAIEEGKA